MKVYIAIYPPLPDFNDILGVFAHSPSDAELQKLAKECGAQEQGIEVIMREVEEVE